jgi:chromosome segregation ATPase
VTITEADWARTPWHARRRLLTDLERNLREVRAQLAEANADLDSVQGELADYQHISGASGALAQARRELRAVRTEAKRLRSTMSPIEQARAILATITPDPDEVIAERRRQIDPRCEVCRKQALIGTTRCQAHNTGRRSDAGKSKPHGRDRAAA